MIKNELLRKDYANDTMGIEPTTFPLVVQCLNQVRHELAHVIKETKSFMDFRHVDDNRDKVEGYNLCF